MNIAFVNRMLGIHRGGGEIWDLQIADYLEDLGADITFYVGKPIQSQLPEPPDQFSYVEVPTLHLRDLAYAAPIGVGGVLNDIDSRVFSNRVMKHLLNHTHDIIHVNSDPRFGRLQSKLDVPLTIKMNGPPHSLWYDYINPFTTSSQLFKYFDEVIATGITSEEIQSDCPRGVHTINPGVNTDLFTPSGPACETEGPTIMFVGRFVPAKNLTFLIEGFRKIKDQCPNAQLWLIGDGPLKHRIESKVDALGMTNSVRFLGYIENDQLPPYYRAADIFTLSSRTENHPIALMEALSCGTPVVAPDIGWIPHMITDEREGMLFSKKDINEFVTSHISLLESPDTRTQIAHNARARAETNFEWKERAERLFDVFTRVIERSG